MFFRKNLSQAEITRLAREKFSSIKGGREGDIPVDKFVPKDGIRFKADICDYEKNTDVIKGSYILTTIDAKELNSLFEISLKADGLSMDSLESEELWEKFNKFKKEYLANISKNGGEWPVLAKITDGDSTDICMYGLKSIGGASGWQVTTFQSIVHNDFADVKFPEIGKTFTVHEGTLPRKTMNRIKRSNAHTPDPSSAQKKEVRELLDRISTYNSAHVESSDSKINTSGGSGLSVQGMLKMSASEVDEKIKTQSAAEKDKLFCKLGNAIQLEGASECFGFSLLAYAKLREIFPASVRIRLVSDGVHNMALIGYEGDDNPISRDELFKQQDNVLIADLWALSMGYSEILENSKSIQSHGIYTLDSYPLRMSFLLRDLIVNFDSRSIEKEALMPKEETTSKPKGVTIAIKDEGETTNIAIEVICKSKGVLDNIKYEFTGKDGSVVKGLISPQDLRTSLQLSVRDYKEFRDKLIAANIQEQAALIKPHEEKLIRSIMDLEKDYFKNALKVTRPS